jgi:hypothetical protein
VLHTLEESPEHRDYLGPALLNLATSVQTKRLGAAPLAGLLYRVRDVYRAAGALICLSRWLHRVPA